MTPRTPPTTPPAPAGYSGTPLAKKLGISDGTLVTTMGAPTNYKALLDPIPADVRITTSAPERADVVHVFTTRRDQLATTLGRLSPTIRNDAAVWVSWPKKASKVDTDITEDVIRELALPLGFVDIKVCAVDAVWSGLKLVIRKADRAGRVPAKPPKK